jgi:hypothetical protein
MAFSDIFKTRKSSKIHKNAWQAIWNRVKTPAAGDAAARELHVVFVGTLLYATRYQAALAAGMEETIARTVALQVVAQASFDQPMRDRVLSVFSASAKDRTSEFAATLNSLVAAVVERAGAGGEESGGAVLEGLLDDISNLLPSLAERLAAAD